MNEVELIPGTALPFVNPAQSLQPEGRGTLEHVDQGHVGPRLDSEPAPEYTPSERHVLMAALRAYGLQPRRLRPVFDQKSGQTDATTGNLVLPFYDVPQGQYAGVSQVTVDVPGSSTITPSAPYANASSWAFIVVASKITGSTLAQSLNASADLLRTGAVAFAPTSAAGPILPGQWTFGQNDEPIAWPGETIYYVLHGGSVAAVKGIGVQVSYRLNLYEL